MRLKILKDRWLQHSAKARVVLSEIIKILRNFIGYGAQQAASLAYYAIFSVFPLLLLLFVIIGNIVGPAVAQEQISRGLEIFLPALPSETIGFIQSEVRNVLQQSASFGLIAIVGLIWSGMGLFSNVTRALDTIFAVPSSRSMWRQRLLAVMMSIVLVILVAASFVTSGVLRLIAAILVENSIWVSIGTIFLPLGLNVVIFALLFRYVPARHVEWDAVWPAAILGAAGWELAKAGFGLYLAELANYQFVYGGLATPIILLFWAYLIAFIFLFSAEFCARLNEWLLARHQQQQQQNISNGRRYQISLRESQVFVQVPDQPGFSPSYNDAPVKDFRGR